MENSYDFKFEVEEELPDHHFRTEIPNVLFDIGLEPHKLITLINYFYKHEEISLEDWEYFESLGIAEKLNSQFRIKSQFVCEVNR